MEKPGFSIHKGSQVVKTARLLFYSYVKVDSRAVIAQGTGVMGFISLPLFYCKNWGRLPYL
jgi:hypothetical protein